MTKKELQKEIKDLKKALDVGVKLHERARKEGDASRKREKEFSSKEVIELKKALRVSEQYIRMMLKRSEIKEFRITYNIDTMGDMSHSEVKVETND